MAMLVDCLTQGIPDPLSLAIGNLTLFRSECSQPQVTNQKGCKTVTTPHYPLLAAGGRRVTQLWQMRCRERLEGGFSQIFAFLK